MKFEYTYYYSSEGDSDLVIELNKFGKAGWEVVSIVGDGNKTVWLKREIE